MVSSADLLFATSCPIDQPYWMKMPARTKVTDFQLAVYQLCAKIPAGKVGTYGWLAKTLRRGSPRSVGQALRHNPFAPDVPCHRVIRSDRTLGGFSGQTNLESDEIKRKIRLLTSEGVKFLQDGTVDPLCVFNGTDDGTKFATERSASTGRKRAIKSYNADADEVTRKRERLLQPQISKSLCPLPDRLPKKFATPADVRDACRTGAFSGQTSGLCPGYAQANLVILPGELADKFAEFCRRNTKACPVLEQTEVGRLISDTFARNSNIATDFPKYWIYRKGAFSEETSDLSSVLDKMPTSMRQSLTAFLIGCSFSFEDALLNQGLPVRHIEESKKVPLYITNKNCVSVGPFKAQLVVSMRPMTLEQARMASQITSRFSRTHGGPIHIGNPEKLGLSNLDSPDFGEKVTIHPNEVPVFWACGVTAQRAVLGAGKQIPLFIAHAPGHMLIGDVKNEDLADDITADL